MTTGNPGTAQFQQMFEKGAKSAQEGLDQFNKTCQDAMKKTYPSLVTGFEESLKQQKQNIDACTQAATLYMKGAEQISQAYWTFCQNITQDTMSATKDMMNAKNMKEFIDMQSDVTKTTFEKCVNEGGKLSEMSVKVANEASQPLQKRANQAVQDAQAAAKKAA